MENEQKNTPKAPKSDEFNSDFDNFDGLSDHPHSSSATPLPQKKSFGRRRNIPIWALFVAGFCIFFAIATILFVPPVYFLLSGPITVTRYTKKQGEIKAVVGPNQKGWMSLKKISRHTVNAIVSAEDGRFFEHFGLDIEEIRKSYEVNKRKNRYARGGSTITQQVVKMAFLSREKTLLRKAREAIGALLLERIMPKDGIIEWHLNLSEFGDGVYGIAEGSKHYFNTRAELLTIEQSVHLALVLPSPNSWSKGLRHRSLTNFGHKRFAMILNRMRQSGYITKTQWTTAITRGDFGRPIAGYAGMLASEEEQRPLCPGNPGCPDSDKNNDSNEESFDPGEAPEDLSFPKSKPAPAAPIAPPAPLDAPKQPNLVPNPTPHLTAPPENEY